MSKFDRKKIAITLAFTALFGNRTSAMNNTSKSEVKSPQTVGAVGGAGSRINQSKGLTIGQKAVIGAAALLAVVSVTGFTIWGIKSKNKKESDSEEKQQKPSEKEESKKNEKNKITKIKNQKGKYYETNIKMIREQSGISKENIEKLIGLINDEDNSLLDNICGIWIDENKKWYEKHELTNEIIEKAGLAKGKSWVEKFLDILRNSTKIHKIEKYEEHECYIYTAEDDYIGFLFYHDDSGYGVEITSSDGEDAVRCRLNNKPVNTK